MSTVNNVGGLSAQEYPSQPFAPKTMVSSSASQGAETSDQTDIVDVSQVALRETSLTGRIALQAQAGHITTDQATQLYQQVASIHSQIVADKKADGGTLTQQDIDAINQLETQLSSTIYSDAHDGAAPPPNPTPLNAGKRAGMEAGRIQLNLQAGNITSTQAQQLAAQQAQIDQLIVTDKQANGGTLTQQEVRQINQMQSAASKAIYEAGHATTD